MRIPLELESHPEVAADRPEAPSGPTGQQRFVVRDHGLDLAGEPRSAPPPAGAPPGPSLARRSASSRRPMAASAISPVSALVRSPVSPSRHHLLDARGPHRDRGQPAGVRPRPARAPASPSRTRRGTDRRRGRSRATPRGTRPPWKTMRRPARLVAARRSSAGSWLPLPTRCSVALDTAAATDSKASSTRSRLFSRSSRPA